MDKQIYFYNFLYDDTKVISEIFKPEEIELMFHTLGTSNDYLKTIWGKWMKARDLTILAALRYLLLRPGEACGIKFSDLNFDKMILIVRGSNNKQKKDRVVALTNNFIQYYKNYMSFPKWMWKNSPYLFPSAENDHISSERWKMIFREKILKPSKLYEPPINGNIPRKRSYLLRATGATEMLDNGADPWTVAQTLGHGDLRTVKNYYFQTDKYRDRQKQFLNTLD